MIKQTYYNLSAEKKNRIINAIKKEVDGKSYDKISINKIVKNAEISRGSFYQYFDDKWDIFVLLLSGLFEGLSKTCIDNLKKSNGDIFIACNCIFDYMMNAYQSDNYSVALRSIFLYSNINSIEFLKEKKDNKCENYLFDEILKYIDRTKFNIEDDKTVYYVVNILISAMSKLWFDVFILHMDKETAKNHLDNMFIIMKNGLLRR